MTRPRSIRTSLPPARAGVALSAAALLGFASAPGLAQDEAAAGEPDPVERIERGADGRLRLALSVEQAAALALSNDLGLEIQLTQVEVARFDAKGSWGAFDPLWAATAAVSDSEFEGSSSLSGANVLEENTQEFGTSLTMPLTTGGEFSISYDTTNSETNNSFQLVNPSTTDIVAVSLRQPLLRGAWREYATSTQREAELVYAQEIERLRQTRQDLLSSVYGAYWDLVAALELQRVAVQTLDLGRKQLERDERRAEVGVGTEVDVLQAEANVAQREQELIRAELDILAAEDALKSMLYPGVDVERWNVAIDPVTELPSRFDGDVGPWEQSLWTALERRSELRRQRLEIDAAELRVARTHSERRAQLDLNLSSTARGFNGDSWDAFESAAKFEFPSHRAELSFSLPIGNRTARNAERRAKAALKSARLAYQQQENTIASEVRGSVREVHFAVEAVRAAQKTLELKDRQLAAQEASQREGLATTFEVLDFQQQYAEALSSERRARVDYAKALIELERASGRLGEAP